MLSFIFTLLLLVIIVWAVGWYLTGKEKGPMKTGITVEKMEDQVTEGQTEGDTTE